MFKESYLYKFLIFITIASFLLYIYLPYDLIDDSKLYSLSNMIDIGWIGYLDDFCVMLAGFWGLYLLVEVSTSCPSY